MLIISLRKELMYAVIDGYIMYSALSSIKVAKMKVAITAGK